MSDVALTPEGWAHVQNRMALADSLEIENRELREVIAKLGRIENALGERVCVGCGTLKTHSLACQVANLQERWVRKGRR